ncbi:MAG TPA: hypothetical protein VGG11_05150 [Xanthobacteraceae bacterium]|jgi:hypothetical protein
MPETDLSVNLCGRSLVGAALALALLTCGCASQSGGSASAPAGAQHGYSGTGSFTDFFAGSSAKGAQTAATAQGDVTCPPVEVRQGASTLTISPAGDNSAMSVRYQGEFVRMARNCTVADGNMTMRIGVEGRVIVGPTGGPGEVVVPLRIAVVQETPGGTRPVTTKFIRIPVTLGPGDGNKLFAHVEEGLSFPVPSPTSQLDDYVAYIGFDPLSAQPAEKPKPRPRAKARPAASAN